MNNKLTFFVLLLAVNIFCLSGFAKSNPTGGLAIELTFYKGPPPAYQTISESAAKAKWAWYSLFKRVEGFQNSADRPLVKAVKFVPYLENETVKINVTVLTGDKFFENEEAVGTYSMRENERIKIRELVNFGVEPFEVAVVRVAPSASALPSVVNKTDSLQVVGVEPNFSTLPSYKINLLNNSEKNVSAFTFETTVNGQRQLSGVPQGEKGEPLIKAGGKFEKEIPSALKNQKSPNEQIPSVKPNETFVITSVIFADGSYEGDALSAAQFRAFALGRKLQLKQIVGLIQSIEKNNFNALAEKALKLETTVNQIEFKRMLKDFPALDENQQNRLRNAAEIASDRIKRDFVTDLEMQIKNSPNAVSSWLNSTVELNQKWIESLP